MFEKIFNNKVVKSITPKTQNTKEVIEAIHNEFNCAGELLLKEAIEINSSIKTQNEKAELLLKLGFKETAEAKQHISDKNKKAMSETLINYINEYRIEYPNYKFITIEMVQEICSKYNLVYGDISLYKGFVPMKNLKQIEKFSLKEKHYIYVEYYTDRTRIYRTLTIKEYLRYKDPNNPWYNHQPTGISNSSFVICAPAKDMNIDRTRQEIKDFKIIDIPDPVVLKEIPGGYLIITAWGDESTDELVVNHTNN